MTDAMDRITFLAVIPDSKTAIQVSGDAQEGGSIKLEVPGTEFAALLSLAAYARGKVLKITVEEAPRQD